MIMVLNPNKIKSKTNNYGYEKLEIFIVIAITTKMTTF
jgi:hypothetical protein